MKRTYKPSVISKKRQFGFKKKMNSKNGKKILNLRRKKKKYILTL